MSEERTDSLVKQSTTSLSSSVELNAEVIASMEKIRSLLVDKIGRAHV
jgi:hypothetical protein